MRTLVLLIGLTLLASCADVSPNYKSYLEAVKHHDTQQAQQATSTISGIQQTRPQRGFETQAESVMFSVIQAMLIERVKYTPISVGAPLTGYDLLSRVTVPILQMVNPWLLWWVDDSGSSSDTSATYVTQGDGDILVNSANSGSQNTGSAVSFGTQTTNFKTEDVCLTCDENGDAVNLTTLPGDPGYECSEGEMITSTCSCETRQAGGC